MGRTTGSDAAMQSKTLKLVLSSDCRLQPACMKPESLVIADQPSRGEYVLGGCTHRPSSHPSWQHLKASDPTRKGGYSFKVGLARGAKS